jgi:glutamate/aspartate transport system substrate-binding protein
MPNLQVKYQLVTSANRIPLIANGTVDLECGSTTNNIERQKQVGFTITHFLTANRYVTKKSAGIKSVDDLKGKTIVSTSGTTNIKQATELNTAKNMGMNIIPANGHPEAFQMVETGRAVAFVMDDILLYTLVAQASNPSDYVISSDALSLPEPYGIMMHKDDAAFKKVADDAMIAVYKSGEINKIYAKWFTSPVPPKGINYNVPMSAQFKNLIANPTSSGDPTVYK